MAKYRIVAESWDEIHSKPGEPLNYTRHRKGAVVEVPDAEVDRLIKAGAIETAGRTTARSSTAKAPTKVATKAPAKVATKAPAKTAKVTADDSGADGEDSGDESTGDGQPDGEIERPKRTAPVEDWVEYAVSKGLARDYASALDRDALIAELS
ncbi:hypothetical protein NXT08_22470 [Rhodococcus pyridinivorans]|uniref:hypothetical protein n=1 Tax=Rhodococcus pyridinivorans TaxID=103816 RepID=UPI0021641B54|nr:hypothetical protein [Rhodococcus pyridinivorans]UVT24969.1 hypothetical protein NXT08_22470 [Rhodococcus pyridinivorans]